MRVGERELGGCSAIMMRRPTFMRPRPTITRPKNKKQQLMATACLSNYFVPNSGLLRRLGLE